MKIKEERRLIMDPMDFPIYNKNSYKELSASCKKWDLVRWKEKNGVERYGMFIEMDNGTAIIQAGGREIAIRCEN